MKGFFYILFNVHHAEEPEFLRLEMEATLSGAKKKSMKMIKEHLALLEACIAFPFSMKLKRVAILFSRSIFSVCNTACNSLQNACDIKLPF